MFLRNKGQGILVIVNGPDMDKHARQYVNCVCHSIMCCLICGLYLKF